MRYYKDKNLNDFESRLKVPNDVEDYGFISEDTKKEAVELEVHKWNVLKFREYDPRLKIMVLWLEKGDIDIEYFHHFANHRRSCNSIWKIENEEGEELSCFDDISNVGIRNFDIIFKA